MSRTPRSCVTDVASRLSWITSPPVKLNVGDDDDDESKTFILPQGLLTANSPFFAAALEGPWMEAEKQAVDMPEDRIDIFELYVHWLYQRRLPIVMDFTDGGRSTMVSDLLIHAYIFGDKVKDVDFMDAVINVLTEKIDRVSDRRLPNPNLYSEAYEETIAGFPLRKLLVDAYTFESWAGYEAYLENTEVAQDVAKAFAKARDAGTPTIIENAPWRGDHCIYHQHRIGDKPCYRTKYLSPASKN